MHFPANGYAYYTVIGNGVVFFAGNPSLDGDQTLLFLSKSKVVWFPLQV